ncbi:acyltransferase [Enterobacter cloacae]|uniref:acyltransferase n=1 Tax=Enterobacter cloacae TaxID=550 RepID=UPI002468BD01|nr:acyltransferase [Enterobacter cloacae]WGL81749.1 acyltransferase [Enterobacter cloacae]
MKANVFMRKVFRIISAKMFSLKYGVKAKGLRCGKNVRISLPHKGCSVEIGSNVLLYDNVKMYLDADDVSIKIGNDTYINRRTEICCQTSVKIGSRCAISWDVSITDSDYHSACNKQKTKGIVIGDNVWIGCKSVILKGITIGDGAIIASGSIVNRDVPPGTLVAGNPAKIVKENVTWR